LRERLKALTGGKGPDVIYDPVAESTRAGIPFDSVARPVPRDRFADGEIASLPLNLPLLKGASVVGVFWGDFVRRELPNFIRTSPSCRADDAGQVRPHISARYPLAEGRTALNDLMNRKATGKVVITSGAQAEA